MADTEKIEQQLKEKYPDLDSKKLKKLVTLEQRKAKAQRQAQKLLKHEKDKARKARTRALIELGGLVAKAGLKEWDKETLLGVLMEAQKASQSDLSKYKAIGHAEMKKEAKNV